MDTSVFKYPQGVRAVADRMTKTLAMPSDRWDEVLYWLNEAYAAGEQSMLRDLQESYQAGATKTVHNLLSVKLDP